MAAGLKNLRVSCQTVKENFNKLLTVPDMQFLEVDNPFLLEDKQKRLEARQSTDGVKMINLREMILRFKTVLVPLIMDWFTFFFPYAIRSPRWGYFLT